MRWHRVVLGLVALAAFAAHDTAYAVTGVWSQSTTRLRFGTPWSARDHAATYDPLRNRVITFGGLNNGIASSEVWGFELETGSNPPFWRAINTYGTPPQPRVRSSMVYDEVGDRVLVFGGYPTADGRLWELSLSGISSGTWGAPNVDAGGPPLADPTKDVRAVLDTARRRLLVISPEDGVWALGLNGGSWTHVSTDGLLNYIGKFGYSAVYDSNYDRLLIFGGYKETPSNACGDEYASSSVYALSLASPGSWQLIATGAPSVADGGVVFDRAGNRILVFGGERCRLSQGGSPTLGNQLWALSLDVGGYVWHIVNVTGAIPAGRYAHTATLTLGRDLYIFGGVSNGNAALATTYRFRPPAVPMPEPRARHVAVYDPNRFRMILWGGDDGHRLFSQDVWAMTLYPGGTPSWSKLAVTVNDGITTFGTRGAAAVFDTRRNVVYVHGGAPTLSMSPFGALYQLSFPSPTTAVWSQVPLLGGTTPSFRMFHSLAYDSTGDKLYAFGGWDGVQALGDTYQGALSDQGIQWAQVATPPAAAPAARYGHVSFFDTKRRRLTVMGGEVDPQADPPQNESVIAPIWGLNVTGTPAWATISTYGGPVNLRFSSAVYNNYFDRAYLTGGCFNSNYILSNERTWICWLYDDPVLQSSWGYYSFDGAPSNHIDQHTSVFDPVNGRLIRFGGSFFGDGNPAGNSTAPTNVTNLSYQLTLPSWVYDSVWSQIASYGAIGAGGAARIQREQAQAEAAPGPMIVTGGLGSRPVSFRAGGSAPGSSLRVQVYDVRGRLIQVLDAHSNDLTWDRKDRGGQKVAPGIYFYRAIAGSLTAQGKLLLTK